MASFSVTNSPVSAFCSLLAQLVPVFMLHLPAKTSKRRVFITHLLELIRLLSVFQLVGTFFLFLVIFALSLHNICYLCALQSFIAVVYGLLFFL